MAESELRTRVDDVDPEEVWERLEREPDAVLVDVRTRAEWAFVGVPDLSALGKQAILIEWQRFPDSFVNESFASELSSVLASCGASQDTTLFFICRSGVRSRAAAEAMAGAGYRTCRNVADGFEGPPDANRHRGAIAGWKAAGLPWVQQ